MERNYFIKPSESALSESQVEIDFRRDDFQSEEGFFHGGHPQTMPSELSAPNVFSQQQSSTLCRSQFQSGPHEFLLNLKNELHALQLN